MFPLKEVKAGLRGMKENPPGMLGFSLATAAVRPYQKSLLKIKGKSDFFPDAVN